MESYFNGSVRLMDKIYKYSKQERILRIIEIMSQPSQNIMEQMEVATIQSIRQINGEIDEVIKQRENENDEQ